MSKDLRIEFRFKNAILLTRLQEKFGEDATTKSMAEAMGVAYSQLIGLLTLYMKPFSSKISRGSQSVDGVIYNKTAMQIANFLGFTEPVELFPTSLYLLKIPKKYHKDFESVQLLSFQEAAEQKLLPPVESYEENYEALGLKERMNQALETLTAREEKIIRMRFGLDGEPEHTLAEVGEALGGVSTERIRQIEKRALKKLRHPLRAQKVKVFYTGEEPPPPEPVEFKINPVVERIKQIQRESPFLCEVSKRIQNRIEAKVKPEVEKTVVACIKELESIKPLTPELEKRRELILAKLTQLETTQKCNPAYDQG